MKFDKNQYEGLVRCPLMMVKKSDENSWALALNETILSQDTLVIKHGQNIKINSRKTGMITFHQ
jgi:hypothetical protein